MKLTDIDLSDKTEVAAAYALLAAVLGEAIPQTPTANHVGEQASLSPADAQPMQDAAAVFGAIPLPAFGAPAPASAPPVSGGTLDAPGAGSLPPQAFVSNEGAASGLGQPAAGVELDSRGLPWDARIHASTKSKTKAGEWTKLRGFNDEAKLKGIEAELRATVQGQQPGAAVPAQGVALLAGIPFSSANNALPQSTGIGATAQNTPVADPVTFEQLMPRVTQATIAGTLPPTALQHVCGALGLPSVVALQTNPAFIPQAWAQLRAAYPALQ